MRKILTFTIDPKDAKDFDDAFLLQKLDNGIGKLAFTLQTFRIIKTGTILDDGL